MAEDEQEKHSQVNLEVRNSILEQIRDSVVKERAVNLVGIGGLAGSLNDLAATDLYSKGPPDNNYSKNTKRERFGAEVTLPADAIRDILKR